MSIDPYASCPCGSGKKFKWCCQPIHAQIDTAYRQHADGQHEAALRTMAEVVAQHSGNPEAHGRHAQLLHLNGRTEEAEAALQKAFAVNPDYAFGHLLRGIFRQQEGEALGALIQFRKAAELYSPEAHDSLAFLYEAIGDLELKRNRPVAARAALARATRHDPANEEVRNAFETLFGPDSRLPESARRDYRFLPPATAGADWGPALDAAMSGRLSDSRAAFESVTKATPDEPAGWYDLALVCAWQGDNAAAIDALNEYVSRETDEAKAASAWTLAEVLRLGAGLEAEADYREHRRLIRYRDPQPLVATLQEWERAGRLIGVRSNPEDQMLSGLILQEVTTLAVVGSPVTVAPLAAYMLVVGDVIRLSHTNEEAVEKVARGLREKLVGAVVEERSDVGPAQFGDVTTEALAFPAKQTTALEVESKMRDHARHFFEDVWFHRPLRSLSGVPPVDAAGHAVLRRKLVGAIQFVQECFEGSAPRFQQGEGEGQAGTPLYDFNRLRRKLGLAEGPVPESPAAPATAPAESGPDFDAMSAAELAGVGVPLLSDEQLERAFRAAQRLDAQDLAARFARAGVARPANADRPDRFPWFDFLVKAALSEGDTLAALQRLDEAERADAEANAGKRADDYQLRRAQVHAKRGEADAAAALFDTVLARSPKELRFAATAAESMLSQRNKAHALRFAETGLARSREQNNRDSEQHFMELVAAAKKLPG